MDRESVTDQRALRTTDPVAWRRAYCTGLDGACPACRAGQPILDRYVSVWGARCHVHAAPAWVPQAAPSMGRSAL